ncbi:MFS transporter [Microbacterium sp.]|uniref:MFS transporter n=1 Tax=Microbacterium sp. TaxID=51671 RepID=UPI002811DAC9|nr:MFS transporter [Microbacterium sp.]
MPENPPTAPTVPSIARRWWLLTVLALAQLMIALDTTIVTIALPSAQADLGFPDSSRQWIITGYALTFGSLLLLSGRLGDRWGRKQTLIAGLVGFAIASAIGGAAPSVELLIAARIAQGAFAALLAPSALALVSVSFTDEKERGRAFGIFGAVSMVGTTIGLLLGGALTEALSWRWTMYINTVIAIPAIIGALILLPRVAAGARQRLDIPGAVAVAGGFFALVLGTSHAETNGWAAPATIAYLAVALILLIVFVVIQTRTNTPLLPLRVILDRARGSALIALLLSSAGLFTTFLFLPFYLQTTLGYPQLVTGLAFLPVPIALVASAVFIGPALTRRFTARPVVPLGLAVAGVGALLLTRLGTTANYTTDLLPSLLLIGAGIGLVIATATGSATAGVDHADAGAAAASVNAAQQIGGSVGVAALSTIAASAAATFLTAHPGHDAAAAVHSYTTAYTGVGILFLAGAALTALIHPKDHTK